MIGLALGLVLAASGDKPGPELRRFEAVETHMGSPFKVILYTSDDATASRAHRAAFDRIKALDLALSDYNPESELMRLCDRAGGPPVKISDDLFDVLARSRDMAERSRGAFDPTIAPVVRLWRRSRREKKLPDPETLAKARALVGYRKLTLDPAAKTARLEAGVRLDLGGIAKGYASDEAIKTLKSLGITRALVAGAGDIVVSDPPPGEPGWTIAIAGLDGATGGPGGRSLTLSKSAVSTSGDAAQFVEIGGVRYSHVVDPRTGVGLVGRCSVTVVARDGGTADALDTAASILGPIEGLALVAGVPGAEVLMVRGTPGGEEVFESPGMVALLRRRP